MDFLVRIFKSVANERRVGILEALMDGKEMSLDELCGRVNLPYKTVSRNLKILEKALLVKSRTWRKYVYFSLEDSPRLPYGKQILSLVKKRKVRKGKRPKY